MGTNPLRSFRFWGAALLGLFLLFSGFASVSAQEAIDDPNEELVSEEVDEEYVETESDSEQLQRTSQRLAELNQIEENKGPSLSSISVEEVKKISVQLGVFGFLLLLLLVEIAFLFRKRVGYSKKLIFTLMVLVVIIPSIYFIASTIYVNVVSVTKGPVHWHADFRIYACGEELPPPIPEGRLANKTGTPILHQHEDKRVHVEGVLVDLQDASLKNFFHVQGGELSDTSIKVPTGDGFKTFSNGDSCGDNKRGIWNVFLYKTDVEKNEISKSKLVNFASYVLSPHIEVPPGDCIIFEFGENIEDTERICNFTQIEINKGNVTPTWTQ